jgi:hypothetical protein
MSSRPGYTRNRSIAALAALQPGIEPVFLILLTSAVALAPADYGWVVGAGQIGMAAGSILCWGGGALATRGVAVGAAAVAVAASLAIAHFSDLASIAALRAIFGLCTGVIFTRSTGAAAGGRPDHAFGTIFFIQLLLSTGVAALLPLVAQLTSAAVAIQLLALCPAAMLLLLVSTVRIPTGRTEAQPALAGEGPLVPPGAAAALFLFVCVTMMIWTYVGAIGGAMGLNDGEIGIAVAIGSLSGAVPAMVASYAARLHSAPAIAVPCAVAMLTPLLALGAGLGHAGFTAALCLFNIGSTYARGRSRRLIAALHCLGMATGPLLGALAVGSAGFVALGTLACGALALAIAALHAREDGCMARTPAGT